MKVLLLRYGFGKQQAQVVSETDTHYEIRRMKNPKGKVGRVLSKNTSLLSKTDIRIIDGWGTDEHEGWNHIKIRLW